MVGSYTDDLAREVATQAVCGTVESLLAQGLRPCQDYLVYSGGELYMMRAIPVSRPHRSSVTSGSRSKWGRTAHCSRGSLPAFIRPLSARDRPRDGSA
jgi:hypothetical protein